MDKKKNPLRPNQLEHYRELLSDELRALGMMIRHDWLWLVLSLTVVVLLLFLLKPLPPHTITLASGQPNSGMEAWGKRYQDYFRDAGIEIRLVPSKGAEENILLLEQGEIDVALSQGGLPVTSDNITSLGSIGYTPLWVFYRGEAPEDNPHSFLSTSKISINLPGSGTHNLVEALLKIHELSLADHPNFLELSSTDSIAALEAGRINALAIVAGMESENLHHLLEDPTIKIYDFQMAEA